MMIIKNFHSHLVISLLLPGIFALTLTSCYQPTKVPSPTSEAATQAPASETASVTLTPTEAPIPMVALVNNEGIPLEYVNSEVLRYQVAFPDVDLQTAFSITLDNAIDTYLLAQAARSNGFVVSDEGIDARIAALIENIGSKEGFSQWLTDNFYTEESFRSALILAVESEFQRNVIAAAVPEDMEQVELTQILVYDQASADQIQQALENGSDFDWLAAQYHPITKGYLGWNARGTFLQPALEETAFSLVVGEFTTSPIPTEYGYHFIKVMAKEVQPLSVQNRQTLQHLAIVDWIETQRQSSAIEVITKNQ